MKRWFFFCGMVFTVRDWKFSRGRVGGSCVADGSGTGTGCGRLCTGTPGDPRAGERGLKIRADMIDNPPRLVIVADSQLVAWSTDSQDLQVGFGTRRVRSLWVPLRTQNERNNYEVPVPKPPMRWRHLSGSRDV